MVVECSVCIQPLTKKQKRVECPSCKYLACETCQTQFGKIICMNCRYEFRPSFIQAHLTKKFMEKVYRPNLLKELMLQQEADLESVDVLEMLRYYQTCAQINSNKRFGVRQSFPEKPERKRVFLSVRFLCPHGDCRGIVLGDTCNVCQRISCMQCHCPKENNHICDVDAIFALKESKPCPKCWVPIYRTMGCDHMHCTNCNTHFNWETMRVLTQSSNHHYQTQLIRGVGGREGGGEGDYCTFSNEEDRIPLQVLKEKAEAESKELDEELVLFLYEITKKVRFYKQTLFNEMKMVEKYQDNNLTYQLDYLLKKIKREKWEALVYENHKEYTSLLYHNEIINMYLLQMDHIQSLYYADLSTNRERGEEGRRLTQVCNEAFQELFLDYPYQDSPFHLPCPNQGQQERLGFLPQEEMQEEVRSKEVVEKGGGKSVQLHDYQLPHVEKIKKIFQQAHFALDLSMLGSGKTYSSAYLYQRGGFQHGLVICPASILGKWEKMIEEFQLTGLKAVSYGEVRGIKYQAWACRPYLIREEVRKRNSDNLCCSYLCSDWLKRKINDEAFLLIVDEIQNIKNDTAQTRACKAIIEEFYHAYQNNPHAPSKALLLSGSPMDSETQVAQFFKTIGVMTEEGLTRFDIGEFSRNRVHDNIETGLAEIKSYCRGFSYYEPPINHSKPQIQSYQLFLNVIKAHLSSEMVMNASPYQIIKQNGFYWLYDQECIQMLNTALIKLNRMVQQIEEGIPLSAGRIPMTQRCLLIAETASIPVFIRLIQEALSIPNQKIVISMNFSQSLLDIQGFLQKEQAIECLILDGSVPKKKRTEIIEKFQRPNNEYRILIGNIKVMSSGIDLDDKDGRFPRICYVSPTYHTIDLYQLSHRFLRSTDTKSNTSLNLVFIQNHRFDKLMNSLARKGNVMKNITIEQSEHGILFPCDFGNYEEDPPINYERQLELEKNILAYMKSNSAAALEAAIASICGP